VEAGVIFLSAVLVLLFLISKDMSSGLNIQVASKLERSVAPTSRDTDSVGLNRGRGDCFRKTLVSSSTIAVRPTSPTTEGIVYMERGQ